MREHRKQIRKLSWRIDEVDDLLGGGIETQSIIKFYGEFGVGKSQITHPLCVNVQLPETYGGLGGRAIFVDSEDTSRPERIDDMVRTNLSFKMVLSQYFTYSLRRLQLQLYTPTARNSLLDPSLTHPNQYKWW